MKYKNRRQDANSHFGRDIKPRLIARNQKFKKRKIDRSLTFQASLVVSLLLVLGGFQIDIERDQELEYEPAAQEVVVLEEIQQTRQMLAPPPPPPPPIPIEVPDDAELEDDVLAFDAEINFDEPVDLPPPPPPPAEKVVRVEEEPEPDIFMVVEEMPQLVGGIASLMEAVEYPVVARRAGIEGTVVIQVIVNPEGLPEQPVVLRSVNKVLDDAAIAAISQQRFTPGKQRGRAVPVRISVPVQFRLLGA